MLRSFGRFLNDETGSITIEYALIAVIVSISIIGPLNTIFPSLVGFFDGVSQAFVAALLGK